MKTFVGHTEDITNCKVSPDGSWFVSSSIDGTLKIWDIERSYLLQTLSPSPITQHKEFHPDASSSYGDTEPMVEMRPTIILGGPEFVSSQKHVLRSVRSYDRAVIDCAISPDGTTIASSGMDGMIRLWDKKSGSMVSAWPAHAGGAMMCGFSGDGAYLISGGRDRSLRVWHIASGKELIHLPLLAAATCMAMHPSRLAVACGDEDGNVYLADLVGLHLAPASVCSPDPEPTKPAGWLTRLGLHRSGKV